MHKRMDQAFMRKCGGAVFFPFLYLLLTFPFLGKSFFLPKTQKTPPGAAGQNRKEKIP